MSYLPKAGLHNVGSYQVSGTPFMTGSLTISGSGGTPVAITFPSITKTIHVHNADPTNALRIGFSANGVKTTNNYYIVDASDAAAKGTHAVTLDIKANKIYLLSNTTSAVTGVSVGASLTGITLGYDLVDSYSGSLGVG